MGKIRTKLINRLLFVALPPLVVLAIVSYLDVYQTRIQSISELEIAQASQAAFSVKKLINDKLSGLRIKIVDPQIDRLEKIGEEQQELILLDLLKTDEALEMVALLDLEGQMKKKFLKGEIKTEPEPQNFKNAEGFFWASQGKAYVGKVIFENTTPKAVLVSPVVNPEGKVIAILMSGVDLSPIQGLLEKFKIGETGYLYLVNKEGNLIAHSQKKELISQNAREVNGVQKVLLGEVRTGLTKEDKYLGLLKEKVIGATLPIWEFGWGMVVEWPEEEALSIVRTTLFSTLKLSLIILIGILAMTFIFAQGISNPIQKIRRGTDAIGAGHFDYKIDIKTRDELEELGSAFNKMAKGLKRLQELRDEFVFIAAHELRAPVTVIRGYILMILEGEAGPVPSKMKEFLSPVMGSSEALVKLVGDLLEVARSEAGKIEIEVKPTDIAAEIRNVLQELKVLSDAKSLKMIYGHQPVLPKILADPNKLKEIIKNLVDNAIKYTIGPGTITIYHETKEKELLTHIKDSGIGMSKENQKKLFQKFFRAKAKGTEEVQGTGLGLWIVKQLIEKMSGKIWVESEEGKGSTFSFSLPIIK